MKLWTYETSYWTASDWGHGCQKKSSDDSQSRDWTEPRFQTNRQRGGGTCNKANRSDNHEFSENVFLPLLNYESSLMIYNNAACHQHSLPTSNGIRQDQPDFPSKRVKTAAFWKLTMPCHKCGIIAFSNYSPQDASVVEFGYFQKSETVYQRNSESHTHHETIHF